MKFKCGRYICLALLAGMLFMAFPFVLSAQHNFSSEDEVKKTAEKYFREKEYVEALPLYSQLLSLHPKDPEFSYCFGVCLLYGDRRDPEKPLKYLERVPEGQMPENEYFYHLGVAYHYNFRFKEAIEEYQEYMLRVPDKKSRRFNVEHKIEMCRNGLQLIKKIQDLYVLDKVEVSKAEFYRSYRTEEKSGRFIAKPEFCQSKLDKRKGFKGQVYHATTSELLLFSSYGKKGKQGKDLYYCEKEYNGDWSVPIPLSETLNTPFDEEFPFLLPDGKTLYFCSKGHNSMGGYDIFKSVYDSINDVWSTPENMDFAINTPFNDVMFVPDQYEQYAWFASERSSVDEKITVYRVRIDVRPEFINSLAMDFSDINGKDPAGKQMVKLLREKAMLDVNAGPEVFAGNNENNSLPFLSKGNVKIPKDLPGPVVVDTAFDQYDEAGAELTTLIRETDNAHKYADSKRYAIISKKSELQEALNEAENGENPDIRAIAREKTTSLRVEIRQLERELAVANNYAKAMAEMVEKKKPLVQQYQEDAGNIQKLVASAAVDSSRVVLLDMLYNRSIEKNAAPVKEQIIITENQKINTVEQQFNKRKNEVDNLENEISGLESDISAYKKNLEKERNPEIQEQWKEDIAEMEKQLAEAQLEYQEASEGSSESGLLLDSLRKNTEIWDQLAENLSDPEVMAEVLAFVENTSGENTSSESNTAENPAGGNELANAGTENNTENTLNTSGENTSSENNTEENPAGGIELANAGTENNTENPLNTSGENTSSENNTVENPAGGIELANAGTENNTENPLNTSGENTSSESNTEENPAGGNELANAGTENNTENPLNTSGENTSSEINTEENPLNTEEGLTFVESDTATNAVEYSTDPQVLEAVASARKALGRQETGLRENKINSAKAHALAQSRLTTADSLEVLASNIHLGNIPTGQGAAERVNDILTEALKNRREAASLIALSEHMRRNAAKQEPIIENIRFFIAEMETSDIAAIPELEKQLDNEMAALKALEATYPLLSEANLDDVQELEALAFQYEVEAMIRKNKADSLMKAADNIELEAEKAFMPGKKKKLFTEAAINKNNAAELLNEEAVYTAKAEKLKIQAAKLRTEVTFSIKAWGSFTEESSEITPLVGSRQNIAPELLSDTLYSPLYAENYSALSGRLGEPEYDIDPLAPVYTNGQEELNPKLVARNNAIWKATTIESMSSGTSMEESLAKLNPEVAETETEEEAPTLSDVVWGGNKPKSNVKTNNNTSELANNNNPDTSSNENELALNNSTTSENNISNSSGENILITENTTAENNSSNENYTESNLNTENSNENNNTEITSVANNLNAVEGTSETANNENALSADEGMQVTAGVLRTQVTMLTEWIAREDNPRQKSRLETEKENLLKQLNNIEAEHGSEAMLTSPKHPDSVSMMLINEASMAFAERNRLTEKAESTLKISEEDSLRALAAQYDSVAKAKTRLANTIQATESLSEFLANEDIIVKTLPAEFDNDSLIIAELLSEEAAYYFEKGRSLRDSARLEPDFRVQQSQLLRAANAEQTALDKQREAISLLSRLGPVIAEASTNSNENTATNNNTNTNNNSNNNPNTNSSESNNTIGNQNNSNNNNAAANTNTTNNTANNAVSSNVQPANTGINNTNQNRPVVNVTSTEGVHSSSNPIPRDPALPSGLIFKVQVAALKRIPAPEVFKGINPLAAESAPGSSYIRFMAGLFYDLNPAMTARNEIRGLGFRDAFVVAYLNGQRISIRQARNLLAQAEETPVSNETAVVNVVNPNENTSAEGMNNIVSNLEESQGSYNITEVDGMFYTVQIGVFGRPRTSEQLRNISPLFNDRMSNGYYRYFTGIYTSFEEANTRKAEVQGAGIRDAFVVAFRSGDKISVGQARRYVGQGESLQASVPEGTSTTPTPAAVYDVKFKVQIGAYSKQVPVEMVALFLEIAETGIEHFTTGNGLTIYTAGNYDDQQSAEQLRASIVSRGIRDAFVVGFVNGKKVSLQEALRYKSGN